MNQGKIVLPHLQRINRTAPIDNINMKRTLINGPAPITQALQLPGPTIQII